MKGCNPNSNVTCKATNCVHNDKTYCMAGAIVVKGPHALEMSKTACDTFVVEGGYGYDHLSSYFDNEQTKIEKIRCSAKNCVYNEDYACNAHCVQIMAANACCGSFECRL